MRPTLLIPSLMLAQTELLGDVVATDYGYDWWWRFNANNGMNDTGYYSYLPYFTLYKFVKSANDVIAAVDVTDPTITDEMRGLGSIAHALPCIGLLYADGTFRTGRKLSIPIVARYWG